MITRTTCPYCGVGCGIEAIPGAGGEIEIRGDPTHPANFGRLCSKGSALGQTLDPGGRLLYPQIDGVRSDWDTALGRVAERFAGVIARHGPDAVAFYVSGQLLTEDYYVANKLIKGFLGSANIDTNSRLCMSSTVAGHKRAFGSDSVPGCYEDWELCDLAVLVGSNTAWCHPVLYQRLAAARQANPALRVVVIDPRRTATADAADLHLPLKSGTDSWLFNGLLCALLDQGQLDAAFVSQHTEGFDAALAAARLQSGTVSQVAERCGLDPAQVAQFYDWFCATGKTLTVFSQGINQSSSGSDKVNAIINCHLASGRIGKPGAGAFSVTGQPNAMGGREVGALSNQLAAHMDFDNAQDRDRVARFWAASNLAQRPGLKAVDLFEAVGDGRIKALWVMATNPAVSMPEASRVHAALERCEFVVVSDVIEHTDTSRHANVLLPAQAWGEKSGTVTNSERRISRQRAFLQPPGEARPDWWILSRCAQIMGYPGFDYTHPREIFVEHAALSNFENNGSRDFNLGGLSGLDRESYDGLRPVQWPVNAEGKGKPRLFEGGGFFNSGQTARFIAVEPRLPAQAASEPFPLLLNTGRTRDQWHTMNRTARAPRLNAHMPEPIAEIHPLDAKRYQLRAGDLVRVVSVHGQVVVRAEISEQQARGNVFVPMHWNDQYASEAAVGRVVNACVDPLSGQPEFKHTPVRIEAYRAAWYGFVLTRYRLSTAECDYWVRIRRDGFWQYEIAGLNPHADWNQLMAALTDAGRPDLECSRYIDAANQSYRMARFDRGRLDSCAFIGPDSRLPSRDWLMSLFASDELARDDRLRLLAGDPGARHADQGKIVCSCFAVGCNRIRDAIDNFGLTSTAEIGERLQAGTNCGSCLPELDVLLGATRKGAA